MIRAFAISALLLAGCSNIERAYEQCQGPDGRCVPEGGTVRKQGEACGALDRCENGPCVDGFCCDRACDGACEACNAEGSVGTCIARQSPDGRCIPEGGVLRGPGEACGSLDLCSAGSCVDGFCCDRACDGQCEACDVEGSKGTCVTVAGAPHGSRSACASDGSACGGSCDGTTATACAYPMVACRAQSCSAGLQSAAASCSAGACPALVTTACAGGICGATACASVVQVAAGYDFTCALLDDGSVWCWGDNSNGQLGVGDTDSRYQPVRVTALANVTAIAASSEGYHACALHADRTVSCWGSNYYGELGRGTRGTRESLPAKVPSLSNVTEIAVGAWHSCAIVNSSGNFRAWCWGENSSGQVGDGSTTERDAPVPVCSSGSGTACAGYTSQSNLALGSSHSCAKSSTGLHCWGANNAGQLGFTADFSPHPNPVTVSGMTMTTYSASPVVFAGADVSCAIDSNGIGKCWGANAQGQLATGVFSGSSSTPVTPCVSAGSPCTPLANIISFSIGEQSTCATVGSGGAVCWGRDVRYQLGNGAPAANSAYASGQVSASGPFIGITAGSFHACVWKQTEIRCWGWSDLGQLGNNDQVTGDQPNPVSPLWP